MSRFGIFGMPSIPMGLGSSWVNLSTLTKNGKTNTAKWNVYFSNGTESKSQWRRYHYDKKHLRECIYLENPCRLSTLRPLKHSHVNSWRNWRICKYISGKMNKHAYVCLLRGRISHFEWLHIEHIRHTSGNPLEIEHGTGMLGLMSFFPKKHGIALTVKKVEWKQAT